MVPRIFSIFVITVFFHYSYCSLVPKKYVDLYNRDCMVVPENNYSTLVMKPIQPNCPPSDCWKSQLTVIAKANLTRKYNMFRHELAQKYAINGMVKVNWHWMLEIEAMKILQYCPQEGAAIIETRNVGGLDYHMSCEELIQTIPMNFKTQADFVNYFPRVLGEQQKKKGKYYKLPSVSHFGCAVIFPRHSARFVCLFCAKADLLSSDSDCPQHYDKDESSAFPHLCTHDFQNSVYGCEPTTLQAHCPGEEPKYRKESFDGSVRYMYSVTDGDHFLIYVNGSTARGVSINHMVLGCEQQGGECAPPLPAWSYVYEPNKMMQLNKTVFFNDNKTFIRYGTNNIFIKMAQIHETYTERAGCCFNILIFFLVTLVPLGIIACLTYEHRKRHPIV